MIAGISTAITSGKMDSGSQAFGRFLEGCGVDSDTPIEVLLRAVDNNVLCTVMCCCKVRPSSGAAGREQRQQCVDETLSDADRSLAFKSRYKSEISYDMETQPPRPFMHRDSTGADTTQRSEYWQGRAQSEIEGYQPGYGMVRRPDIVIVKDAETPPYQSNIERVVEMKFQGDLPNLAQDYAYRTIAGGARRYSRMQEGELGLDNCSCADRKPVPVLVAVPRP